MSFRKASKEVEYGKPAKVAFQDVQRSFLRIGQLKSADDSALLLEGKVPYGLQRVTLRVEIVEKSQGCVLSLTGKSDDIWAMGAKKAIDYLLDALQNLDNPAYVPPNAASAFSWRQITGAFSALLMCFGSYSFVSGRSVPWGYAQTLGATMFGVGIAVTLLASLWPRRKDAK